MKGAKGVIVSIVGGEDMRLMEVDEAASHIKELVDPDANIIWGSAFNNELEGRIRVSVVATGIEAEEASKPATNPSKVFAFPTARNAAPAAAAPVMAPAPAPAAPKPPIAQAEEAPLELGNEDDGSDELLLDSDDILTSPVGLPPIAPPVAEDEEPAAPRAAQRDSGTLFERMSNIARGAAKVEDGAPAPSVRREPLDIPRFLNRQNNQ
jgi:cell division protein FtsZ